jgi:predicted GNAT family N-acyltransferase
MITTKRVFENSSLNPVHGPITPAEVREGDLVSARLISVDPRLKFSGELRVWRISPLGVELLCKENQSLPKGLMVDLELQIGVQKTMLSGLVVEETSEDFGKKLLHIRLTPKQKERVESIERRQSTRWICSEEFYPTAISSNPARFNDFVYFKLRDISSTGLKLHTSLRNKFIVAGMSFDCLVNFPMVSQIKMKLLIKSVRVELLHGKEVLSIGAEYDSADRIVVETVGQYLMQFGSVGSLDDLRNSGIQVNAVGDAVQFSYVRTKEEYDKVLGLRHQAYKDAGKLKDGAQVADMSDAYDARARIVIGKYKGEVVCSSRLIFNQFEDTMEQEKFVKWPSHLPRRDEMVEIMRACTRPDFRKSDLLISMFKFIAVTVAQSKRKWIVICATDDMIPLYKKIGFTDLELNYLHTGLNDLKHNILLANVPDAMEGKTVDMFSWNIIWSDVSGYLEQYGIINPDPLTTVRLHMYRLMGPVARFAYARKKKRLAKAQHKKISTTVRQPQGASPTKISA